MRVAAYTRVSLGQPDNLKVRLEEIRQLVGGRGWQVVGIYSDLPSGRRGDRSAFRQLLADAARGKFDAVVVPRFDEVAQSLRQLVRTFERFRRRRLAVFFLEENIDTAAPTGALVYHVMAAVGQFERRLHREHIRVGLARARSLGRRVGRPPAQVDPAEGDGSGRQG